MEEKIMVVFYGRDNLPYKDKARETHYPIIGSAILGENNVTSIRFYVDQIGANNRKWVAQVKKPDGSTYFKVLETGVVDTNGTYVSLSIESLYSNQKGNVQVALNGYEGNVVVEEEDDTYTIHGTPSIVATGVITIAINYAPMTIPRDTLSYTNEQLILAGFGAKLDFANGIIVYDDITDSEELASLDIENGQIGYDRATKRFYKYNGTNYQWEHEDIIVYGYYYNGAFYKELAHTTLITAETNKLFIDLATNTSYIYNDGSYVLVGGGSGGISYYGENGVIVNNTTRKISADTSVVATKSDLTSYSTTTQMNTAIGTAKSDALNTAEWKSNKSQAVDSDTTKYPSNKAVKDYVDEVADDLDTETSERESADTTLQEQITNLQNLQRYLSLWNATTGLPTTQAPTNPYIYKTGDYYVISVVGSTNYKPDGTSYTGVASQVVETNTISVGDRYIFDGSVWVWEKVAQPDTSAFATKSGNNTFTGDNTFSNDIEVDGDVIVGQDLIISSKENITDTDGNPIQFGASVVNVETEITSNTPLNEELFEKIKNGCFVNGVILGLYNPMIVPCRAYGNDYYGIMIGRSNVSSDNGTIFKNYFIYGSNYIIRDVGTSMTMSSYGGAHCSILGKYFPTYPTDKTKQYKFVQQATSGNLAFVEDSGGSSVSITPQDTDKIGSITVDGTTYSNIPFTNNTTDHNLTIGTNASIISEGTYKIAIGENAKVGEYRTGGMMAIGYNSLADGSNSIAIGNNAKAWRNNIVCFDGHSTTQGTSKTIDLYDMDNLFFRNREVRENYPNKSDYANGYTLNERLNGLTKVDNSSAQLSMNIVKDITLGADRTFAIDSWTNPSGSAMDLRPEFKAQITTTAQVVITLPSFSGGIKLQTNDENITQSGYSFTLPTNSIIELNLKPLTDTLWSLVLFNWSI